MKRSPSPGENMKQVQDQVDKQSSTGQTATANRVLTTPTRARTPPPKQEAFEQFRQEGGKQINDILLENKGTLM